MYEFRDRKRFEISIIVPISKPCESLATRSLVSFTDYY